MLYMLKVYGLVALLVFGLAGICVVALRLVTSSFVVKGDHRIHARSATRR